MKEKMIRTQVSITNGELEVLKEWMPLSDAIHEDALVNGIVNQIIKRGKNDKSKSSSFFIGLDNLLIANNSFWSLYNPIFVT